MFELHELLSWIWSIGLVCSAAYYYFSWLHDAAKLSSRHPSRMRLGRQDALKIESRPMPLRLRLVRLSKRKDAPDDDGADCRTPFQGRSANEWGGYYSCPRLRTIRTLRLQTS